MFKSFQLIILATFFVFCSIASTAHAAGAGYTVTIDEVGNTSSGSMYLRLTDTAATPAFAAKWFISGGLDKNKVLATCLTAFAMNQPIWIYVDIEDGIYPGIVNLYIKKQVQL